MNFTVTVYQQKRDGQLVWHTLGLGPLNAVRAGKSRTKLERALADELRTGIRGLTPREVMQLELVHGRRLRRVRLELTVGRGGKRARLTGLFPMVFEPRLAAPGERVTLAYHPLRPDDFFVVQQDKPFEVQARRFLSHAWAGLSAESVSEALTTDGRDVLRAFSFTEPVPQLLEQLAPEEDDVFADLVREKKARKGSRRFGRRQLRAVAENVTARVADGVVPLGRPREPERGQLSSLIGGVRRAPVVLIGPPGVGKSTLLMRLVSDLLEADDYRAHRNLDRVREVWRLSAKRILAGMSHVGDWEKRCVEIAQEASDPRVILWVDDLHTFGRAGRTRDSDRALSDVFRGPLLRGECTLVGEATRAQWHRLSEDAPAFADRFTQIRVTPTSEDVTFELMLHEARELERARGVRFHANAYRAVLTFGEFLHPGSARPGFAVDLLRRLAMDASFEKSPGAAEPQIDADAALSFLAQRTGLPQALLRAEGTLDTADLERRFAEHVIGQDEAVAAAVDLVTRIRAGLVDPARPFATYLFTGPTGTGKTQMAKAIAGFLYGSEDRLTRIDMGEMSAPDSVARLVGDRFDPRGLLTEAVRQQPFSVVLLDEIEKAHPAVLQLLLQLLDEGRLTDAGGDTADFRKSVVVMTSNLGARPGSAVGFGERVADRSADVMRAVRDFFVPELFNRIDRVVTFKTLSEEAAELITEKELAQLLARRGLSDRRVFVFAHREAVRSLAREAFDSWAGARSVKRYLETEIGGRLSDELARGTAAEMRIVHVYGGGDGGYRLRVDELTEAAAEDVGYELEGLVEESTRALRRRIRPLLERLRALRDSEGYAAIGDSITELTGRTDREARIAVYDLDSFRAVVDDLCERVDGWARGVRALDDEVASPRVARRGGSGRRQATRGAGEPVRAWSKAALLETIAEVGLLERAIDSAASPDTHRVLVELLRVGQGRRPPSYGDAPDGFLEWMVRLYAGLRGDLLAAAALNEEGRVVEVDDPERVERLFSARPLLVALEIGGVAVKTLYEREEGCHVWSSLLSGSEILRVRVLPAGDGPGAHVRGHRGRVSAFEDALQRGEPDLPEDPRRLLPAVRRVRFDPPRRPGETAPIEVEDYRTSRVVHANVTRVEEVLPPLVWLRASGPRGDA